MSLLPVLLNEILDYHRPRLGDFGLGPLENELINLDSILTTPLRSGYLRPWRSVAARDSGLSTLVSTKDEFKVNLDVQQFKPNELNVKVENGYIVISGKHEERCDEHGFISRQFTRRYKVPEDIQLDSIVSNLSSDGVLSLHAAKKAVEENPGRKIPIIQTNAAVLKSKEEGQKTDKMEGST